MILESPRPFNAVADLIDTKERKTLVEALWAGSGHLLDAGFGQTVTVVPDIVAEAGEVLFYVGFPGVKRDNIPTQHYMVGARDEGTAVAKAHELYKQQPRTRKGASLRIMLGRPPSPRDNQPITP